MNAHTQFPVEQVDGAATAMRSEIEGVEQALDHSAHAGEAGSFAERMNNMQMREKFGFYRMSLIVLFAAILAGAAVSLLGPAWSGASAIFDAVIAVVGIVWVTMATRAMNRDLLNPLVHLIEETDRLANGARDVSLPGLDRKDEIGKFGRTIEFLTKAGRKMDEMYLQREQAEAERQEQVARRQQELLDLATQFESSVGDVSSSVAAASEQLNTSAAILEKAAGNAVAQTEQIADAIDQVAKGSTAAAAASDEFALSIEEISRQAANSAALARKTNEAAAETDRTVSELTERAQSIGEIAELIDGIAGRTNLLALNASIEAARGGDSGRGFAVVASEVKELANQTRRATGDVTGRISEMQDHSQSSAAQLRAIGEQIRELEIASVSIASAVDQQSVAGKELAMNVDLAANGAGEVSATTGELRKAAMAAGSSATQVLAASDDLKAQATMLNEKVGDFLRHIRQES